MEINNKFGFGEEVWTAVRVPVEYECPVCKGEGQFLHNGYAVKCNHCRETGKVQGSQCLLQPVKVKIRRIVASIWEEHITIKYKVDCMKANVRNRQETTLFKTREECEEYCKDANTKEICAEF